MAKWATGKQEFACSCGAKYEAHYKDFPERERGSFNCLKCGIEVLKWKGTRDYLQWDLMPD